MRMNPCLTNSNHPLDYRVPSSYFRSCKELLKLSPPYLPLKE